ncbi:MAG TPA: glycosyltransferase family 4 protein [Nitratidesulfovibrio sp.]|nr:glycosyltransferase family 4 protein [Nitratidesulfovibrio sp.]
MIEFAKNVMLSATSGVYSKIIIVNPADSWSLYWDAMYLEKVLSSVGLSPVVGKWQGVFCQTVFYVSKYMLVKPRWHLHGMNRVTLAYYHGYPGTGSEMFDRCYATVKKYHEKISRIQVTHAKMHEYILDTGIDERKIRRIYIAVDTSAFIPVTPEARNAVRKALGVPESAVVVGSFQKDGEGWGGGDTPKAIKGPDIFVDAMRRLKADVPELHVLLTGPARGFVKAGLAAARIPFTHVFLDDYRSLPPMYHALDAYLVSSREEGGPKAVLESMASGVPLVTTPVGQASELVRDGQNGLLATGYSAEELSCLCRKVLLDTSLRERLVGNGLSTAASNSYDSQGEVWKHFFDLD